MLVPLYNIDNKGGDGIVTKAQLRATAKYDKNNYKSYHLRLRKDLDKLLIEYLDSIENKNDYLRNLIAKDLEK